MKEELSITKRKYYAILILVALLVFSLSLHYLFIGKDRAIFEAWQQAIGQAVAYEDYLVGVLGAFFQSVTIPAFFAVYLTYVRSRGGYTKMARTLWNILLVMSLFLTYFSSTYYSLFVIFSLLCYLFIIITNNTFSVKGVPNDLS